MLTQTVTIINKRGLHARAAAKLVTTAGGFKAQVQVRITSSTHTGPWVDAKSVMSLMLLAATQGTVIDIMATGDDEAQAVETIIKLIDDRFDEGE